MYLLTYPPKSNINILYTYTYIYNYMYIYLGASVLSLCLSSCMCVMLYTFLLVRDACRYKAYKTPPHTPHTPYIHTQHAAIILAQFFGHHSKEYIRSFTPDVGVLCSAGITPLGGGSLVFPGKDAANPTFRHLLFTKDALYDMWSFYLDRE